MAEPSDTETGLDRVLDATVDSVLAFVAVWLVLTVVVRVTTNAVGSPTADATLQGVVALVACGCIYPFVTGPWPLGRFLRFVLTVAVVFLAISVAAFVVMLAIGGVPTASRLLQFATVVALAIAGAASIREER